MPKETKTAKSRPKGWTIRGPLLEELAALSPDAAAKAKRGRWSSSSIKARIEEMKALRESAKAEAVAEMNTEDQELVELAGNVLAQAGPEKLVALLELRLESVRQLVDHLLATPHCPGREGILRAGLKAIREL